MVARWLGRIVFCIFSCIAVFGSSPASAQDQTEIFGAILSHYYKNEKAIVKGRNQLLFTFCDRPANNEEIFETVNALKLPASEVKALRQKVAAENRPEDWSKEFSGLLESPASAQLKSKVNDCLSLEQYQEKQKRFNLNNQRLMIVYRPLFYDGGRSALVKVVFYRSIEHNNGAVLKLGLENGKWAIKEFLNPWST